MEVRDRAVAVVAAGEGGAITARNVQSGATASAAVDAVRAVASGPARLGLAVRDPVDPVIVAMVAAAARAAGATGAPRVVTRGTAVALAEHWCGAARGANHVVTLTAADTVHAGIVINGLVILSNRPIPWNAEHTNPPGGLEKYYRENVIGGPGAFVLVAENFQSFGRAIIKKLVAEIASLSSPPRISSR